MITIPLGKQWKLFHYHFHIPIICAYRLAFKLAYDQAVLGEADDLDELVEYLEEYESDWYMGSEKDKEWVEAIKQEKTQLFSLIHDPSEVRNAEKQQNSKLFKFLVTHTPHHPCMYVADQSCYM